MKKVPYNAIKSEIQTGDLIAWRGFGGNPIETGFSLGIMAFTGPVTHCSTAIVTHLYGRRTIWLAEAMASGFMIDSLDRRLIMHKERRWKQAWWFPLSQERKYKLTQWKLTNYLIEKVEQGTKYDATQAIGSAFRFLKNKFNDSKLFCSESHMAALMVGGAVGTMNPSEAHPMDVVRFDIHRDCYQIFGKKMELKGINTVEPEGWNE
jgi:hypothetical protein